MNKNKKLFGKAAGVFALALVLSFSLAACGDGGGGGGGGGGGSSLGDAWKGETLLIEGAQLYFYEMSIQADEEYEKFTGDDIEFTVESSQHSGGGQIGGQVTITGGKLTFTADIPVAENLENVQAAEGNSYSGIEDKIRRMGGLQGIEYTNFVITGEGWETAKFGELATLSHYSDDRDDELSRERLVYEQVDMGDHNYSLHTISEDADYIYVDTTITVKADGGTKTTTDKDGDSIEELKPLDITLKKGWNVIYSKYEDTVDHKEIFEIKAGDPSKVYWLNDYESVSTN